MTPRQSKASTAANRRAIALIKAAHSKSGMTRAELAEASGVPDGTLAGLFAGTKPLYAEQLVGLAFALGADVQQWFDEMEAARVSDLPETLTKDDVALAALDSDEPAGAPEE